MLAWLIIAKLLLARLRGRVLYAELPPWHRLRMGEPYRMDFDADRMRVRVDWGVSS